jgi:hypothetical protein
MVIFHKTNKGDHMKIHLHHIAELMVRNGYKPSDIEKEDFFIELIEVLDKEYKFSSEVAEAMQDVLDEDALPRNFEEYLEKMGVI